MLDGESETHGHMHMCGDAHACIHGLITTNGRAPPPAYDRIRRVAARYRVRLTTAGVCTCMYVCSIGCVVRASVCILLVSRPIAWVPPCERGRAGLRCLFFAVSRAAVWVYIHGRWRARARRAWLLKSHSNTPALRWRYR